MNRYRAGVSLVLVFLLGVCCAYASEDKTHPEVKPDDYEWSLWMSPSTPPGEQFRGYTRFLVTSLPALQVVAQNGLLAPTTELMHAHARLILKVLEGAQGPNADLCTMERDSVDDVLDPLTDTLLMLTAMGSFPGTGRGIIYMRGGLLWAIDWGLPQLNAHALEAFPLDPAMRLQIERVGQQIQTLMIQAQDSAVACILEEDYDSAAGHLLDANAFLFSALGSPLSGLTIPPCGTGLYYLMQNLLGWERFY